MLKIVSYLLGGVLLAAVSVALLGWLWLRAPDLPAETLEAKYAGPTDHFVELRPGLRVHYRDQGDVNKPLVVLLHGYGDSYATWEGWTPLLSQTYRVISLDLPGHGLTAAPDDFILNADAYVQTLADFADKLKLPPFVLAGNSMGGGVSWKFALTHQSRLKGLALVDAAGWPHDSQGQSPSLAFRILQHPLGRKLLASIDNRPLITQGLSAQVYDKSLITDELVSRWAEYQRYPGHRRILMSAAPTSQLHVTPEQLSTIHVPTLVLHGDYDPLIPLEDSRRFAASIPGAKLVVYHNVGHMPQREIPQRSAQDFLAFVSTLP